MVRTLRIWSLWFRHRLAVLATVFDSRDVFGKTLSGAGSKFQACEPMVVSCTGVSLRLVRAKG